MASTAARKASTATATAPSSWEPQLDGLIAEIKAWEGSVSAEQSTGLVERLTQALNKWQRAPIAAVRGHVRAVRLEDPRGSHAADKRLLEVLRCSKLLRVRLVTYTRTIRCMLEDDSDTEEEYEGEDEEGEEDEEEEDDVPVDFRDRGIMFIESDEPVLNACWDPRMRKRKPATLPAELSVEALESRLLCVGGRTPNPLAGRTPRDLEAVWGKPANVVVRGSPRDGGQICIYTFKNTLAVFWPKAFERTLPCVGGLEPTVRLLEELMGELTGTAPPQEPAVPARAVAPPAPAAAPVTGPELPGQPSAAGSAKGLDGPRQGPDGPSQGPDGPSQGEEQAQALAEALAQLVLLAALDMAPAEPKKSRFTSRPHSLFEGQIDTIHVAPIPRLIHLISSPLGRSLAPWAGPAACATLLDCLGGFTEEGDAQALEEAEAAFSDPAFEAALVRFVERTAARQLGPCLQLALAATLPVALQQAMAILVVKAATTTGGLGTVPTPLVVALAARVVAGEPHWREHAEAVTAAVMKSGREYPGRITAALVEPSLVAAMEGREPRALAFASGALAALTAVYDKALQEQARLSSRDAKGRGRGWGPGPLRSSLTPAELQQHMAQLRAWLQA
ncbi:hypothetical protein HYH03_008878 [Edaphochlamys debaryana]|uniref:Uncharacterized protein n=1 Tax=Edaphochlamys debaryana TaxID=47281 RepID=A0A836BXP3_9CHLO|nr:hypothetical protein HYH03_008878 [Edaphochlamys debaryana]|eukprot:KAG2492971.1 hypothetical protein HYH03_008878 [Edaphochlamys debaryana]